MHLMQKLLLLSGRILISLIFILSAFHKIFAWQSAERGLMEVFCDWQTYEHGSDLLQNFFSSSLPFVPAFLVAAVVIELLSALMVLFGVKIRFGAFMLALFLLVTTIFFHPFWFMTGMKREMELVVFLKNSAILGGLLYILALGSIAKLKKEKNASVSSPDLRD